MVHDGNGTGLAVGHEQVEALSRVSAMQRVQTQYNTAISVQKPRSLSEVERRFLQEADLAGTSFYYGWTLKGGGGRIEGGSIDLAVSLLRCWGNCVVQMEPVQETYDAWIFTASFVDLETGFTLSRQFRQSKNWTVSGQMDTNRKEDIRFQIGQSKAIRNVALNALPKWLSAKGIERAKAGVMTAIEKAIEKNGIESVQDAAMRRLGEYGVPVDRVLEKFGRRTVKAMTIEDLVTIKGDMTALETGADTADVLYPEAAPQASGERVETGRPASTGSKSSRLAEAMRGRSAEPSEDELSDDRRPVTPTVDDTAKRQAACAASIEEQLRQAGDEDAVTVFLEGAEAELSDNRITAEQYDRVLFVAGERRGQLKRMQDDAESKPSPEFAAAKVNYAGAKNSRGLTLHKQEALAVKDKMRPGEWDELDAYYAERAEELKAK